MTISKSSFALMFSSVLWLSPALGCGLEPIEEAPQDRTSPFDAPAAGVRDGHLAGQVGPAWVDAVAEPLRAYAAMSTLRVMGVALQDDRAVMMQVTLRTDDVALVPGTRERFDAADVGRLVLLGCVGQSLDVYDEYDRPADDVELVVDPVPGGGPGDVSVLLDGLWGTAEQSDREPATAASFSFVLVR
ncbi:MAG: hypothetical protein A2138_15260 [Deltaproteobacteria bacterium RBG_16_71_12]|nr:MAG: hypothetical protein A2138_15260 [Deltaproteobacteria bacterium RBG_16_71_12]